MGFIFQSYNYLFINYKLFFNYTSWKKLTNFYYVQLVTMDNYDIIYIVRYNLEELRSDYLINIEFNNKRFNIQYMLIQIIYFALLTNHIRSASQPATWTVNPLLISGEHKAINFVNKAVSTFSVTQTYNTSFSVSNQVVLSLEGYKQNPPVNGSRIGFKISIFSTSFTGFTANVTVYGVTMSCLYYMYLGIATTATEYFPSYNTKAYSSGNLIDINSTPRSITETYNNPSNQTFPNYLTNTISNIIFLAGFNINVGTTGTYINLTSLILSSSTHSVTTSTKGDVQIFQVSYFRLAFDKTAIMQGYINIIDSFYFQGVNSTQLPTNTTLRPAPVAQYRNFLMGLTHINLPTITQGTDIVLQLINTTDTLFTFSGLAVNNTSTPTYEYFYADIFHHRKRVCQNSSIPYYYYVDEICYDICPDRTYPITPANYCQKCHYSCFSCNGVTNLSCTTCSSNVDFRLFGPSNTSCICMDGYFQSGVSICTSCIATCKTCSITNDSCLSCNSINQHRQLNSSMCVCMSGYFQTSFNTPTVCNLCDSTCLSCLNSATYCTSCDTVNKSRSLNSTSCLCIDGYFQNTTAVPPVCEVCHILCLTCSGSLSTNCLSCNTTYRDYINNSCACKTGTEQPLVIDGTCISVIPVCGNGVVQSPEICDDNNTSSQDGCSVSCIIEQNHECIQSVTSTKSVCYYNKPLDMTIQSVLKVLNDNKVDVVIKIQALLCNLDKLKQYLDSLTAIKLQSLVRRVLLGTRRIAAATDILSISSANFVITDWVNYEGYLSLSLSYTETIPTLQNKKISFVSTQSETQSLNKNYFISTPITYLQLQDPYNKIPMSYYDTEKYNSISGLSYVFLVLGCINLAYFVVMAVLGKSAIAVENIIIFQFCYFCILGLDSVQLAIASLAFYGKYSVGININIINSNLMSYGSVFQYNLCTKMPKIYQQCNAIDNINITFYVATVLLIVGLAGLLYKKKKQNQLDEMVISATQSQPSNYFSSQSSNRGNINNENEQIYQVSNQPKRKFKRVYLTYEFPSKIANVVTACLELSVGLYFMTAIEYLLTAVNQNDDAKIPSIVWLLMIGIFFIFLWVFWFKLYPISQLSYITVLKPQIEKISFVKIFYTLFFIFLVVWGAVLGAAPGIVSYVLLILWSLTWLFFTIRKKIYHSRILNIRSILNQIYIIVIVINFIILQYAFNDGLGLANSVVLLIILIGCTITNVSTDLYNIFTSRKNEKKLKQNLDEFKSEQRYFKNERQKDKISELYNSNKNETKLKNISDIRIEMTQRKVPLITSRVQETQRVERYEERPDKVVFQKQELEQNGGNIEKKVEELKNLKKQIRRIAIPNNNLNTTNFHMFDVETVKQSRN